jgi:hypothetical protein
MCSFWVIPRRFNFIFRRFGILYVPKRRHIKLILQRNTQKKKHNIHNTANFGNQGIVCGSISIVKNTKNGNIIYNCYWEEIFKCRMLRPFTLDVHTVCRWTLNLLLKSRTEITVSAFWENYFSLRETKYADVEIYIIFSWWFALHQILIGLSRKG